MDDRDWAPLPKSTFWRRDKNGGSLKIQNLDIWRHDRSLREAILSQKAEVLDVNSRISECDAARDDYRERLEVARKDYDDLAQATALSKESLEVELNEAHRRITANEMR